MSAWKTVIHSFEYFKRREAGKMKCMYAWWVYKKGLELLCAPGKVQGGSMFRFECYFREINYNNF